MKSWRILLVAIGMAAGTGLAFSQDQQPAAAPGAADVTGTNALAGGEVVPLITIDEAPLTDAIRTLARQAGINFQFDPRVTQGAVGADGKPIPQPNVSLRWENVTALQALHALLENHALQLVPDPRTRIHRITIKDPAALEPLVSRVIQLQYSNPSNIVTTIAPVIAQNPRNKVTFDPRTSQLVILATEREMDGLETLIKQLDTQTRQILIEARFIETRSEPHTIKGIDWSGTLAQQRVEFGNTTDDYILPPTAPTPGTTTIVDGTPVITGADPGFGGVPTGVLGDPRVIAATTGGFGPVGFINADGVSAVISFLNTLNDFEQIATPRAVALEGVATELSVVQNIPVFEEEQGANTGGTIQPNTVKPNYNLKVNETTLNEVGIKLIVTPRVYGVTNVMLDLRPEISEQGPDATTTLGGRLSSAPTFLRKKIVTQAMVPSGNTLVLGGLKEDDQRKSLNKVPILGDLPGLGLLFRKDEKRKRNRELLIFVTPTIIGETDYQPAPNSKEFLQTPPREADDAKWGPWNSAEPYDWTKPLDEPRN